MDKRIEVNGFKSERERRQALVDCTDIMWEAMSEATHDKGLVERFLLAKSIHNDILSRMVEK